MTLDCSLSLQQIQSRVISVRSYYLTSLVNLAFYSLIARFRFEIHSTITYIHLAFPLSGKLLRVGVFSGKELFDRLIRIYKVLVASGIE